MKAYVAVGVVAATKGSERTRIRTNHTHAATSRTVTGTIDSS